MFQTLVSLFSTRVAPASSKKAPIRRRTQLAFDTLEGRELPSASPIHAFVGPLQAYQISYATPVVNVPNLTGVVFANLVSSNGKPAHVLAIQSETILADGSATFTGTWSGKGANGGNEHVFMNGTLKYDAGGNLTMSFSWTNGSGSTNTFNGVVTHIGTNPAAAEYVYGNHWHLDGNVTTPTAGDGPGHISGDGGIPLPMLRAV